MPPAPPVRMIHLGIGNFHRAHQAWYTAHAEDAADWGYAGFTGNSPRISDALAPQDGLYTLVTQGADGDHPEVIGCLAEVHPAADHEALLTAFADPKVAVVTITVTEQGYLRGPDGRLDTSQDVVTDDIATAGSDPRAAVVSAPARIAMGLAARRAAGAGAITILSCDNLPANGEAARQVVIDFAEAVDPELAAWIAATVDFATSMVDRITPATTPALAARVEELCGWVDASPVPTEPFHEWVVAGRFPAGRPRWETAGARMVDDVEPYEQRKLWLLNGSHSLLAYAGSIRGHETVEQAIKDPVCRGWVELFWAEASRHLVLPQEENVAYRQALVERFENPNIRHNLAQIAHDGSTKLVVRTLPTIREERAAGRVPRGCATALAAWTLHLRGLGAPVADRLAGPALEAATSGPLDAVVPKVLDTLAPGLGSDTALVACVLEQAALLDPEVVQAG
ncbi:mannitol dehydrogenase family protein [Raineyella fluvialis]|uniref:Mannitol-1-phosphate 5-dehydrogenase n=2 Tax=Raineyella fluvialis TaxID=2662261 RepID=A0A5Q2FJ65_9ACTN|nr:mannitol dehydrogenase family protein [Raineyella fluvialis]